jgi:nucleotide-binding universal stress UspA family protein
VIVVGYDGSGCGHAALAFAIDLAKDVDDEILITYGYEPTGMGEEKAAHRDEIHRIGERVVAEGTKEATDAGVKATAALIPELPIDALLAMAAEHDARVIVVGTYSEHPIKGAILGSTPYKLVHLADRPVVVVPA